MKVLPPFFVIPRSAFQLNKGNIRDSNYFRLNKPLLWLLLILGRLPFQIESGLLCMKVRSSQFLYSLVVSGLSVYVQYYYFHFVKHFWKTMMEDINFKQIIFSVVILMQINGTVTTIYSWLVEAPCIIKNYNFSAVVESRISFSCPSSIMRRWVVNLIAGILGFYFIVGFGLGCYLLADEFSYSIPFPMIVACTANFLITQAHGLMWCIDFLFIRYLASELLKNVKKCFFVEQSSPCFKLKLFRRLWIHIWKLSIYYSNSHSLSLLSSLLLYGIVFIASCYGIAVTVPTMEKPETLVTVLMFHIITITYIFSIFETGHQAKCQLHDAFVQFMLTVDRDKLDIESAKEVERFLKMLLYANTTVSLKGFLNIGRPLIVSFLSSATTYIIVLLQVAKE